MSNLREAVCVLTQGNIKGFILFSEKQNTNDILVSLNLQNVPPGKHGFHIHTSGDLREGCSSLCSHFNPYNSTHGGRDDKIRHVGDLGNITANKSGIVKENFYDNRIKLRGRNNIIGRSVIIHEDEDDLGKGGNTESLKTGNAGKRIACGVIGYSKKSC